MRISKFTLTVLLLMAFGLHVPPPASAQKSEKKKESSAEAVLWRDPGDIASRDLSYGPGSAELAPAAPFTFVEEVKGGESPKFKVRDARGVEWGVKMGQEAQAETVSTRLLWAVGYFAEESYYFDEVRVENMPRRLSRGQEFVAGGVVRGARFEPKRAGVERGPEWSWSDSPFAGTREMSGLKVLMILLNNFDARKGNNSILLTDAGGGTREARYVVTDLGATLGRAGGLGGKRTKNSLEDFISTKFVRGVDAEDGVVEFDYDTRPRGFGHLSVLNPKYYRGEVKKEKAMRGIPVEHARWIGSLLSRLSDEQLRAAFRAARYDEATTEGYVRALRERIDQLTRLQSVPPVTSASGRAGGGSRVSRGRIAAGGRRVTGHTVRGVKKTGAVIGKTFGKIGGAVHD